MLTRLTLSSIMRWPAQDAKGDLLLETVIAVTLFTLIGAAVLGGLSTAHFSGTKIEGHSTAENVVRNQMALRGYLPPLANGSLGCLGCLIPSVNPHPPTLPTDGLVWPRVRR